MDTVLVGGIERTQAEALTRLRKRAAAQVAKYPQYAGKFDEFVLVRVKRRIKTKMGNAFVPGEVTIAALGARGANDGFREVWSFSNMISTSVEAKYVEDL